jgi:tetratricopeptide (TPR) repeat protein
MRRRPGLFQFASVVLFSALSIFGQTPQLGSVDFPTTGTPEAQRLFLKGLAAIHSFWYEEALEAFQASTKADPGFAMGYWGEAMTHNHPIWLQQDADAGRRALAKISSVDKLTVRERAFIEAARTLYGQGDKLDRDRAYTAAMEKIYRDYPDDLESAAFYSLALLGEVRPGDKGFARQMKAGAIALAVYQKNPNHPGAAHYVIHAFDDPEHAILALPAAFRYAKIAPAASHATHMPSHIFLQLGMWPEAAESNEAAWKVSDDWVKNKKLALNLRDYHSNQWLTYVYCQQGRFTKAEERINYLRQEMKEHGRESVRWYDDTTAAFLMDSGRWAMIEKLFDAAPAAPAEAGHAGHGAHGAAAPPKPTAQTMLPNTGRGMSLPLFVRAYAAASLGAPEAERLLAEMRSQRDQKNDSYAAKILEIRELEVTALLAASKKNFNDAITAMKKATALEGEMSPPSGPPTLLKPSHELYGEILLRSGRPKEAAEQFTIALNRQPNRARALLGAARAAVLSENKSQAMDLYKKFLDQWRQADADLPELREAREFLGQTSAK